MIRFITDNGNDKTKVQKILKNREDLLEEQSKKLEGFNLELKRSNSDLEHFAYAASHDLREPLRVISSFTGLLARSYQDTKDKETVYTTRHEPRARRYDMLRYVFKACYCILPLARQSWQSVKSLEFQLYPKM